MVFVYAVFVWSMKEGVADTYGIPMRRLKVFCPTVIQFRVHIMRDDHNYFYTKIQRMNVAQ